MLKKRFRILRLPILVKDMAEVEDIVKVCSTVVVRVRLTLTVVVRVRAYCGSESLLW
jgi:hypothetical protein